MQARYDTELPPFMSIVRHTGRPVILGMDGLLKQSPEPVASRAKVTSESDSSAADTLSTESIKNKQIRTPQKDQKPFWADLQRSICMCQAFLGILGSCGQIILLKFLSVATYGMLCSTRPPTSYVWCSQNDSRRSCSCDELCSCDWGLINWQKLCFLSWRRHMSCEILNVSLV